MLQRLATICDKRVTDILKMILPNGVVLAIVSLPNLNEVGKLIMILLSIGYGIWRWRRDSYVVCQRCREGRVPEICTIPMNQRPTWCPRKPS